MICNTFNFVFMTWGLRRDSLQRVDAIDVIPAFQPYKRQSRRTNRERADTISSNQSTINDIPGMDGFQARATTSSSRANAKQEQSDAATGDVNANLRSLLKKVNERTDPAAAYGITPSLKDVRHTREGTQIVRVKDSKNLSTERDQTEEEEEEEEGDINAIREKTSPIQLPDKNMDEQTGKLSRHSQSSLAPVLQRVYPQGYHQQASSQFSEDFLVSTHKAKNDSVVSALGTHYVQYSTDAENTPKFDRADASSPSVSHEPVAFVLRQPMVINPANSKKPNIHDRTESQQSALEIEDVPLQPKT
ncbi:hypothetical protein RFI_07759 [Reticulomyxa filosa]|uniref:Uncharacterized protein n=1 Tax=Reticulomyxa filosa TaxID=46433 RepID=X6NVR9_RETFI|nr:hypothetical protein RFI_07759 [Reticulomyxa filosa]|eukprot:ETO29362.1 hypothetical protein RFI_07759 [Reticulomyxa filosa]